jgi:DNA-directed RNA polymerase specialized sigma24 family protein
MCVDVANQPGALLAQTALATEQPRLVAFCAHVSASWDAAEDLAQETLLEAWRPNKARESAYRVQGAALAAALEAWGAESGAAV